MAGCFEDSIAWIIKSGEATVPQPEPRYASNAREADQVLWRHAIMCPATKILLYCTGKCGCKRKQAFCGPGCVCSGCKNVPEISTINTHSSEIHSSSDSDVSSDDDLETEIITDTDYFMPINVIDI